MDMFDIPEDSKIITTEELFDESKSNPNNFSAWAPQLAGRFKSPESYKVPLTLEWFDWLLSDNYTDKKTTEFGRYLQTELKKVKPLIAAPLFLKTETFSNKFSFENCLVNDCDLAICFALGKKALSIFYGGLCGDRLDCGFIFRKFIDFGNDLEKIYGGMPLHTEFRAFYDFDDKHLLGVRPYWDSKIMMESLLQGKQYGDTDYIAFEHAMPRLEKDYCANKQRVADLIEENLRTFEGRPSNEYSNAVWSLDFMLDTNDELWFIDAANATQSAFYDELSGEGK